MNNLLFLFLFLCAAIGGGVAIAAESHEIEVHFFYRDSTVSGRVTEEKSETLKLSVKTSVPGMPIAEIGRAPQVLEIGDFVVSVLAMTHSLDIRFETKMGTQTVAALKYQMTDELANQFGGHGFTGLNYIYHPKSEAEIQCWAVVVNH